MVGVTRFCSDIEAWTANFPSREEISDKQVSFLIWYYPLSTSPQNGAVPCPHFRLDLKGVVFT